MNDTTIDRYRRGFEYEKDSHAKTLASLTAVPDGLRQSKEFREAVYLLWQIVAARRMWFYRFEAVNESAELLPTANSFVDLPAQLADMEMLWEQFLSQLNDQDLARFFEYTSYAGLRFQNTLAEIFTQLFGLSWDYRVQIAVLLRAIGAEPAAADFVACAGEPSRESKVEDSPRKEGNNV